MAPLPRREKSPPTLWNSWHHGRYDGKVWGSADTYVKQNPKGEEEVIGGSRSGRKVTRPVGPTRGFRSLGAAILRDSKPVTKRRWNRCRAPFQRGFLIFRLRLVREHLDEALQRAIRWRREWGRRIRWCWRRVWQGTHAGP